MHEFLSYVLAELKGSWRFRWLAMSFTWIVCIAGWSYIYSMPDVYESEAIIYVDTSSSIRPLLQKLTIGSDLLTRVQIVTMAMLGREQLEKVARETDLILRASEPQDMDHLLRGLRQRIVIRSGGKNNPHRYAIRYRDSEREMAQSVVQTLLNIFVEDSLGASRKGTRKAQGFLREQLELLEVELNESELRLAEFKKQNIGRMPGSGGDYFSRLQDSIAFVSQTESELTLASRRRDALVSQLSGETPLLEGAAAWQTGLDTRIAEYERRLEGLQLRFTDNHPDVLAVKETIARLQAQKSQEISEFSSHDRSTLASDNPVLQNIQIVLANVNVEIAALEEQEQDARRKVTELRGQIDILPRIETELLRFTRNYDVTQAQYQALLQRLEVAELSEAAEQSEDIQFRIINPPSLPDAPVAPNRSSLLIAVLLIGLGCGAGIAFLGNQIQPVYTDLNALRISTGLPVLGSIRQMRTLELRRRRGLQMWSFISALAILCVVFGIVIGFQDIGIRVIQSLV